jgi:hypothetical protein
MAKKIIKGWRCILSFSKKGLRILSTPEIKTIEISINKRPPATSPPAILIIPSGTHIKVAPIPGIKTRINVITAKIIAP